MRQSRRTTVAVAFLGMLLSLLGVVSSGTAHAAEATGWPLRFTADMYPDNLTAFGNDTLSSTNCGNPDQAKRFAYVHQGVQASSLPVYNNGSTSDSIACLSPKSLVTADGTFYGTHVMSGSSHQALTFAAYKNGRALWETDLSSDPVCSAMSSWGADFQNARMTNASIGSDGNIYGIVEAASYACATYLVGISSVDGHQLFTEKLLTSNGSWKGGRAWVYNDKILTLDASGLLRQFNYDGNEVTSAQYQFPTSVGLPLAFSYANPDGRVFAVGSCGGSVTDSMVAYHDPSGDAGVVASGQGCNPGSHFTPGANGNLIYTSYAGSVTTFHAATASMTVSSANIAVPSGIGNGNAYIANYWQDASGNAIMVRELLGDYYASAGVSVDFIDGSTGAVTNLFLMGTDATHPSPETHASDIAGGYLYSLICNSRASGGCPNSASTSIDAWVHKIPLTGFGTAVKDTGGFATYANMKKNYVAIGDSFASGQFNGPYISGTDVQSGVVDTCHRSAKAYSVLLDGDTALVPRFNLNAFVACSGATTDEITNSNAGNHEPAQVDAVTPDTDLITMSIGGNDIGFPHVMSECTLLHSGATPLTQMDVDSAACVQAISDAASQVADTTFTDHLASVYANVISHANAQTKLVVVGYPQLFPDANALNVLCQWGSPASDALFKTSPRLMSATDVTTLRALTTALNSDIATAVTETGNGNIVFADPTSAFAGHERCTADPWFSDIVVSTNPVDQQQSFHPTAAGQIAYESAVEAEIATLSFG